MTSQMVPLPRLYRCQANASCMSLQMSQEIKNDDCSVGSHGQSSAAGPGSSGPPGNH